MLDKVVGSMPARTGEPAPEPVLVDPESVGVDPEVIQEYSATMRKMVRQGDIPGCASIVMRHGRIFHLGTYGYADLEAKKPFRMDTICRIVCMTKSYVATAFMTLVDEGLVRLEDRLDMYLPAFADVRVLPEGTTKSVPPRKPLLLKHVISHTAGFGYAPEYEDHVEGEIAEGYERIRGKMAKGQIARLRTFVDQLAKVPLMFHPGENYQYGFSLDVLARVVEVVMGRDLEVCLRMRVFDPLGMHSTKWCVDDDELGRLAACYASAATWGGIYADKKDAGISTPRKGMVRIDGLTPEESGWRRGQQAKVKLGGGYLTFISGGLVSTAADTFNFIQMLLRNGLTQDGQRLLKAKTIQMMERDCLKPSWGQGSTNYLGMINSDRAGEYGMGGAACTYWSVDRKNDVGTVWFTQMHNMAEFTDLKGVNPKRADLWQTIYDAVESQNLKEAKNRRRSTDCRRTSGAVQPRISVATPTRLSETPTKPKPVRLSLAAPAKACVASGKRRSSASVLGSPCTPKCKRQSVGYGGG